MAKVGVQLDNKTSGVTTKNSTIKTEILSNNSEFVDTENNKMLWKERMFKVHNKELTLRYADPSNGVGQSEKGYEIINNGMPVNKIELQEGLVVTLDEPVSILETHKGAEAVKSEDNLGGSVYFMSPAGEMSFDLRKLKGMEEMKAAESVDTEGNPTVPLGMFQLVLNFNADGKMASDVEISAYLRDSLKLKTKKEDGTQNRLEMVQGEYRKLGAEEGVLQFADSFVVSKDGITNMPEMMEIHFKENENGEDSTDSTKENYHYKAFGSTAFQLYNAKDDSETISADTAKTKLFGFTAELKEVSMDQRAGILNANKGYLKWGDFELELEKIQLKEKRKKVNTIHVYKRSDEKKEHVKMAIMERTQELEFMELDGGVTTEVKEVEAQDGLGLDKVWIKIKDKKAEFNNVAINENFVVAEWAKMPYGSENMLLSKAKLEKGSETVAAEKATMELGEGKVTLNGKEEDPVAITDRIQAPTGTLEITKEELKEQKDALTIEDVIIENGLELFAKTATTDIDGFSATMTAFNYKEGGKITYDGLRIVGKVVGKTKDENAKDSAMKVEQQFMDFSLEKGDYSGGLKDGIKSTGYWATGNIRRIKVKEKPKNTLGKKGKVLQRLKEMQQENKKVVKRAPKIKQQEQAEGILQKDIYTLDGFAKVQNTIFEFVKDGGEAKIIGDGHVKFNDIPTKYYINDVLHNLKNAFAPEDAVEDVKFTIDGKGNLNAAFEDDAEAKFNLKGIKGKENSGEGTIYTITLKDLSIENGYLKAGAASLERGLKLEQEAFEGGEDPLKVKEEAKKFFGCELSGSIVNEGTKKEVSLTEKGIEAYLGKNKPGKFGVSGFIGFLNGEVNFPSGEITVSAEKSYEPEKVNESFFHLDQKTPEIEVDILTPIPGLGAELKVTPSVGIAGAVGLGVNLGKSFEEWDGKALEFKGVIETEGQAGIGVGAGVNVGAGYLGNIDLILGGELKATIEGELSGKTAFKLNKEEKSGEKMQQSNNFSFEGSLGGKLAVTGNVSSTAKFLFWKKQLFNIELFKKELGELKIKGKGEKSKDKSGLLDGWQLTSGEFNASWFKNEIRNRYYGMSQDGKTDSVVSGEEFNELVKNCSDGAESAWAVLCKLQEQSKDTAIILSEADKAALDLQIEAAKTEVKKKIIEYLNVLNVKKAKLDNEVKVANTMLTEAKNTADAYAQKQGLAKDVFEKASWGGFNKEKYKHQVLPSIIDKRDFEGLDSTNKDFRKKATDAYNKEVKERNAKVEAIEKANSQKDANAAVDLMITYMLGQVSDKKINLIRKGYFEQFKIDLEEDAKKAWNPKEYAGGIYRSHTSFVDTIPEYFHQNNYYHMLNQKAVYSEIIESISRADNDALDGNNFYLFKRSKKNFHPKIQMLIEENENITMKELLESILEGEFTAEEKLDFIKNSFLSITPTGKNRRNDTRERKLGKNHHIVERGNEIKRALFESVGKLFSDIFESTSGTSNEKGKKTQFLEDAVKGKNVFDIFDKLEELNQNVEMAKAAVAEAEGNLAKIKSDMTLVRTEFTTYQARLGLVAEKATQATANKNFDANAAKKAIALYSENYVEKIQGNNMQEALEKVIEKKNTLPKSVNKL